MTSYRKTMTESLREMYPLDERMRMPRQLIDTNKEVMIVKKNKVIVIDKKDQDKYMKQGWELAEEVGLNEGTIDKVKEIASKKQAMKIDGVMVDSFTASAISQIYDKVNDANKKKMDSLPITKLANLAMKMMQKNDYVPEGLDLDEGTKQVLAHGGKGKYKVTKDGDKIEIKFGGKVVGTADFDRGADSFFVSMKGEKGQKSFDDAQAIADYFAKNKITEEVELDEGKMNNATMQANKPRIEKAKKLMGPSTSRKEGIQMVAKGMPTSEKEATKLVDTVIKMMQKNDYVPEEVDLDENLNQIKKHIDDLEFERKRMTTSGQESLDKLIKTKSIKDARKAFDDMYGYEYDRVTSSGQESMVKIGKMLGMKMEEVDLEEASASADARRAMRRDPDMKQRAFSKDDSATDDDKKAASKNIMMQMRKAQSLNGKFDVEFQDGKKIKIPAKMAIAVQQKYNSMRKPSDKEAFQAKVGKSYRDMLNALKEEAVSPAQQAAIAISKKERGEKPKKESILDRIDRKIKENKNG